MLNRCREEDGTNQLRQDEGCEHNAIFIFRKKGLSEQQAVDAIGDMYKQLYRDWYRALADMPVWGEKVDREMLRYIDSVRDVPLGNSYWR